MLLTNPSLLATVLFLLTGTMVEAQDLPTECCAKKVVGNVSYTLLPGIFHGELPSQCHNGCVYTVSGTSSPKFCFKKGDLPSGCFSDLPGTGCPESGSGAPLPPNGGNGAGTGCPGCGSGAPSNGGNGAGYGTVSVFVNATGTSVEHEHIPPCMEPELLLTSQAHLPPGEDNNVNLCVNQGSNVISNTVPISYVGLADIFRDNCVFILTDSEDSSTPTCNDLLTTCESIDTEGTEEELVAVSALASWNLRWCPRRVTTNTIAKLCDYPQCCFHPTVRGYTGLPGVWSCLVAYTKSSCPPQNQLHFEEGGETYTQEHVFNKETGILEVHVPAHANYTKSKYLVSEGHVLLNTNGSCQLSERPPSSRQVSEVLGVPLPSEIPDSPTYHVMKVRKTRVTHRKRQELMSAHKEECKDQAITLTEDVAISEEDYHTMKEGGVATINGSATTRKGCRMTRSCSSPGPHACGRTGYNNTVTGVGFSFHQVSTGTICVQCKRNVTQEGDECRAKACWCEDIDNGKNIQDCVFKEDPVRQLQIEEVSSIRSQGGVFNQTTTYSGDDFEEKSFKIEVPAHQWGDTAFEQLTVVMHSAAHGFWHNDFSHDEYSTPLKDNMLFKRGDQCLITTIPDGFYPVDGAIGMNEIVDLLTEQDFQVQHSVLLDEGEMTADDASSLKPPILEECSPSTSNIRKVTEVRLKVEQATTLEDGGVVLLPQQSSRACSLAKAIIRKSARNSWYWPNSNTGAEVALQKIIHEVEELTCCVNTPGAPGPCCDSSYPNLCLCNDIVNQNDFLGCLECELKPEVVQSTAFSSLYAASNVLILGEVDAGDENGKANFWLAEGGKTTGQGFTVKVGGCKRLIAGIQIKNKGKEFISGVWNNWWSTKEFRVSGSMNENGPWETLLEDQLADTTFSGGNIPASLRDFTFEDPVEIQFLKFDLISFWGSAGGGLQYFAPILA